MQVKNQSREKQRKAKNLRTKELDRIEAQLQAEKKVALEKIEKKYAAKKAKLTEKCYRDHVESYGHYLKGRGQNISIAWKSECGCENLNPKSEWKKVLVEDWGSEQTFTDAGYGDDDCFRMRLRETTYRMCPHCKHLVRESSRLLQEGPEYRRCESDEFIKKCDIRPADWARTYPKITIKD